MKKFFSKIAQRAFALAISIMVVTNTFAQGAAGIDAARLTRPQWQSVTCRPIIFPDYRES